MTTPPEKRATDFTYRPPCWYTDLAATLRLDFYLELFGPAPQELGSPDTYLTANAGLVGWHDGPQLASQA